MSDLRRFKNFAHRADRRRRVGRRKFDKMSLRIERDGAWFDGPPMPVAVWPCGRLVHHLHGHKVASVRRHVGPMRPEMIEYENSSVLGLNGEHF